MPDEESHEHRANFSRELTRYLRSVSNDWPEYRSLYHGLEDVLLLKSKRLRGSYESYIFFHDVLVDNNVGPPININYRTNANLDVNFLEQTLRRPPTDTRTRLIFLDFSSNHVVDQRVLNSVRLILDIDPYFFGLALNLFQVASSARLDTLQLGFATLKITTQLNPWGETQIGASTISPNAWHSLTI